MLPSGKMFRMRFALTVPALFALFASSAAAAIDFTPSNGERVQEGIVFKQVIFHQDGHAITYEQPRGWNLSGDPAGMRLTPPDVSQAQVTVQQSRLSAPQVFDDATKKQLQQMVLASAPNGATNVAFVGEEESPLQIHLQPTYAVTIGYSYFGQDYGTCVLFVNLGDTQVRFRTVARKADFERIHRLFRGSLFSLAWQ